MLIQCDFDGTVILNNLSVLIRESFAQGNWREIEADYLEGRITVEQSNTLQYRLVREPRARLQEFVRRHIEVRPGFREFVAYCQQSGIPFVIVSSGLDFYIETVLAEIGMAELELHCGRTSFAGDGIAVHYTDPDGNRIDAGFKGSHLAWLRRRGSAIVYLGDGQSDLEPARKADHVFAGSVLRGLLDAESIVAFPLTDFHEVIQQLRLIP